MIKPGTHLCKVLAPLNGWFGEAGKNSTPFLRIPLEVIDGECEGEQITYQGWISDAAVDRTCKVLSEVFGWNGDMEALASHLDTGPFVGKECEIVCEEEEYDGKRKVVIKWLNAPGSSLGSPMPQDKMLAIARRLQTRAKAAATGTTAKADPALDMQDSDIPF